MKQSELAQAGGMVRPMPKAGNSGEKTEDLKDVNAALEDTKTVTTIEDRLKNLGALSRGNGLNPAAADEDTDDDSEESGDDQPKPEEADGGDDKPAEKTFDDSETPTPDDTKGLPEAYVRCALAYGWKEQDVLDFYKSDPEHAMTTLSNIYNTRNKATSEFAALGRRVKDTQAEELSKGAVPVDTSKLREQHPDWPDEAFQEIEKQNVALVTVSKAIKPREKQFESAVEASGVEQQVHNFFEADRMKPWQKVYGKLGFGETWRDLSASQQEHRMRLVDMADKIAGGAHMQGVNMPLDEVLESAHLLVTQRYRDQVLVDGLKAKVETRAKGMTLVPSKGTKKPGTGVMEGASVGSRTKEQLAADTQKKLDKLFNGG